MTKRRVKPLFEKIAIIGMGLIGSSLALACRARGVANHIVGCSRTQKTIDTATGLGLIDEGTLTPAEAVQGADMVVICTPLGIYNSIASSISKNLDSSAILTDTGSVKHLPTEHVLSALSHEQGFHFVPGHPIAGTEKSGPEAGFKELFEGRKAILTPLPITDSSATEKVKEMWRMAGAEIDILDPRRHDFIYASVSHSVQLLSSCFGLSLGALPEEAQKNIKKDTDINFKKFIRLAGSDPVMWRDIFLNNIHNIESTIDVFFQNMTSLKNSISSGEVEALKGRLEKAYEKRIYFHDMLKGEERREFRTSDYSRMGTTEKIWMDILPRLISCVVMEGISETEYEYATGAGLHGFTKNIILHGGTETKDMFASGRDVVDALNLFTRQIKTMLDFVLSENSSSLYENLIKAQQAYEKFTA